MLPAFVNRALVATLWLKMAIALVVVFALAGAIPLRTVRADTWNLAEILFRHT